MLPTLSSLSVSTDPGSRLRHWCSSRYLRISPLHREFHFPLSDSSQAVSSDPPRLSRGLSHPTYKAPTLALRPVIPNNARSLRITAAAGTELATAFSRGTVATRRYPEPFLPSRQSFTTRRPSSPTRRRCVRVSPIAQDSPLLPPVGVWTVFQFQCGWPPSQASYPSLPW